MNHKRRTPKGVTASVCQVHRGWPFLGVLVCCTDLPCPLRNRALVMHLLHCWIISSRRRRVAGTRIASPDKSAIVIQLSCALMVCPRHGFLPSYLVIRRMANHFRGIDIRFGGKLIELSPHHGRRPKILSHQPQWICSRYRHCECVWLNGSQILCQLMPELFRHKSPPLGSSNFSGGLPR